MKRTPLKRKTALRKQSPRRKTEYAQYIHKRALLLAGKFCEFPSPLPCINRATEIHHIRGRSGKMLLDEAYYLFICREHHRWIHDHGKDAKKMGLLQF